MKNLRKSDLRDRKQFEIARRTERDESPRRRSKLQTPAKGAGIRLLGEGGHPEICGNHHRKGGRLAPSSDNHRNSRHLFKYWNQVKKCVAAAKHLAIFLDFDGTLTPLRRRPTDAILAEETRALLGRLARQPSVTLCIISGRRREDLQKRVNVRRTIYLGLHGWERDKGARSSVAAREILSPARRSLTRRLSGLPHVWVGDKGPCFEVHYQGASPATIRKTRAIVRSVLRPLKKDARILPGRKIWEILPREIEGKGAAVRALLAEFPRPVLSIYAGDDFSDESAFQALPHGVTVRVGSPRRTKARFQLRNPEEVVNFLQKVEAEIT